MIWLLAVLVLFGLAMTVRARSRRGTHGGRGVREDAKEAHQGGGTDNSAGGWGGF